MKRKTVAEVKARVRKAKAYVQKGNTIQAACKKYDITTGSYSRYAHLKRAYTRKPKPDDYETWSKEHLASLIEATATNLLDIAARLKYASGPQ